MSDDSIKDKDRLECAWKHFSFIADQRIKTFNFYIILLAASFGGTVTVFDRLHVSSAIIACGLWHILIGALFLVIDIRSRRLLEVPKTVLRHFESAESWTAPKLILADDEGMKKGSGVFSFTTAFRATFGAQIAFGVILIGLCLFSGDPKPNKPLHGTPAKAPSSSTESEGRRP